MARALHVAKGRVALGTGLRVAELVARALACAEGAPVAGPWVVAQPMRHGHAGAARARALAPRAPRAPVTILWGRWGSSCHACVVLAPLQQTL